LDRTFDVVLISTKTHAGKTETEKDKDGGIQQGREQTHRQTETDDWGRTSGWFR